MKYDVKPNFLMFLIGLGALTKIYFLGCLSISEMVVFFAGPFILLKDYPVIKRDGCMVFIVLLLLNSVGLLVGGAVNNVPTVFTVKALAMDYSIFAHFVIFHRLIRKSPKSIGWFFAGSAISGIITIFAFNPQAQLMSGDVYAGVLETATDAIVSGPLFWVGQVESFMRVPLYGWYMNMPWIYAFSYLIVMAAVTLATTSSGRSATLIVFLGVMLLLLGGKSRTRMFKIGRHIFVLLLVVAISGLLFKSAYAYLAQHGYLSDEQQRKYEWQSRHGGSALRLLMSGRIEFFVGLRAALDAPILGHGPMALDSKEYYYSFVEKYGDSDDVENYLRSKARAMEHGYSRRIPTHSHIIGGWVSRGIFGLIFWTYILWMMYQYLRRYAFAVPQLFGYCALSVVYYGWHILFSPMGVRSYLAIFIAAILYVRSVALGRAQLSFDLDCEAKRHE